VAEINWLALSEDGCVAMRFFAKLLWTLVIHYNGLTIVKLNIQKTLQWQFTKSWGIRVRQ